MAASHICVADSSPLVASCQFSVGGRTVADIVLPGAQGQIPPEVYTEVVTQGKTRPEALTAARLITAGHIRVADATGMEKTLEDIQHYRLGQGKTEVLSLTARLGSGTVDLSQVAMLLRSDYADTYGNGGRRHPVAR